MQPTVEEKERFLQYVREGDDRPTAAWRINPEYTGTMFKRMCNPSSKRYDAEFAESYEEAVEQRGPLDPNRAQIWSGASGLGEASPTTSNGFTKANHLSHDQLEQFLDLVRDGTPAAAAAKQVDPTTSITQIHRRASRDADFAEAFRDAKDEGHLAFKDEIRAEGHRQAFAGDYRALKDLMLMHLDEARALMTSRHEVTGLDGGQIRLLAERHFADLPPEMLDEMIRTLEEKERGQLGPGTNG